MSTSAARAQFPRTNSFANVLGNGVKLLKPSSVEAQKAATRRARRWLIQPAGLLFPVRKM